MSYTFSRNLFETELGSPMVFNVHGLNDVEEVRDLIEFGGGMEELDREAGPYSITLLSSADEIQVNCMRDVFDAEFILKSAARNTIQPLKSFRLNKVSIFKEDFNPNEVLNHRISWTEAIEKWQLEEEELHPSAEIESDESTQSSPCNGHKVVERRAVRGLSSGTGPLKVTQRRNDFTEREREDIINFIVQNKAFDKVNGTNLWKRMSTRFPLHTWQSLKNHFLKKIMPSIKHYNLQPDVVSMFKSAFNGGDRSNQSRASSISDRNFSKLEDNKILQYVKEYQKPSSKLGGNCFWQEMERRRVVRGRTWQSLRGRYINHLKKTCSPPSGSQSKGGTEKKKEMCSHPSGSEEEGQSLEKIPSRPSRKRTFQRILSSPSSSENEDVSHKRKRMPQNTPSSSLRRKDKDERRIYQRRLSSSSAESDYDEAPLRDSLNQRDGITSSSVKNNSDIENNDRNLPTQRFEKNCEIGKEKKHLPNPTLKIKNKKKLFSVDMLPSDLNSPSTPISVTIKRPQAFDFEFKKNSFQLAYKKRKSNLRRKNHLADVAEKPAKRLQPSTMSSLRVGCQNKDSSPLSSPSSHKSEGSSGKSNPVPVDMAGLTFSDEEQDVLSAFMKTTCNPIDKPVLDAVEKDSEDKTIGISTPKAKDKENDVNPADKPVLDAVERDSEDKTIGISTPKAKDKENDVNPADKPVLDAVERDSENKTSGKSTPKAKDKENNVNPVDKPVLDAVERDSENKTSGKSSPKAKNRGNTVVSSKGSSSIYSKASGGIHPMEWPCNFSGEKLIYVDLPSSGESEVHEQQSLPCGSPSETNSSSYSDNNKDPDFAWSEDGLYYAGSKSRMNQQSSAPVQRKGLDSEPPAVCVGNKEQQLHDPDPPQNRNAHPSLEKSIENCNSVFNAFADALTQDDKMYPKNSVVDDSESYTPQKQLKLKDACTQTDAVIIHPIDGHLQGKPDSASPARADCRCTRSNVRKMASGCYGVSSPKLGSVPRS